MAQSGPCTENKHCNDKNCAQNIFHSPSIREGVLRAKTCIIKRGPNYPCENAESCLGKCVWRRCTERDEKKKHGEGGLCSKNSNCKDKHCADRLHSPPLVINCKTGKIAKTCRKIMRGHVGLEPFRAASSSGSRHQKKTGYCKGYLDVYGSRSKKTVANMF